MIETASLLLAKATSTTSDAEALALVERAYSLLAQVINDYDDRLAGHGAARRRERRRRTDRRRARAEAARASQAPAGRRDSSIARFLDTAGADGAEDRAGVDVSL